MAAVIETLTPDWKDLTNYLKHKRKEMFLEDLIIKLQIEEDKLEFRPQVSESFECKGECCGAR